MLKTIFRRRFFPLRYPIIGILTYLCESSLYGALLKFYGEEKFMLFYVGAGLIVAVPNFIGHTLFTFRGQQVRALEERIGFDFVLKCITLGIRSYITYKLVHGGITPYIGLVVTPVVTIVTFLCVSKIFGGSKFMDTLRLLWLLVQRLYRTLRKLLTRLSE